MPRRKASQKKAAAASRARWAKRAKKSDVFENTNTVDSNPDDTNYENTNTVDSNPDDMEYEFDMNSKNVDYDTDYEEDNDLDCMGECDEDENPRENKYWSQAIGKPLKQVSRSQFYAHKKKKCQDFKGSETNNQFFCEKICSTVSLAP